MTEAGLRQEEAQRKAAEERAKRLRKQQKEKAKS